MVQFIACDILMEKELSFKVLTILMFYIKIKLYLVF